MVQNGPSHASGGRVHLASLDWTLVKSMKQTMRLWSSGYDRGFPTTFYYERWETASNPGSNPGSRIQLQVRFATFRKARMLYNHDLKSTEERIKSSGIGEANKNLFLSSKVIVF